MIPAKRKRGTELALCKKRIRKLIEPKLINSPSPFSRLRKDLFIQIFDFLDHFTYYSKVPLVCSFFYNFVKENSLTHLALRIPRGLSTKNCQKLFFKFQKTQEVQRLTMFSYIPDSATTKNCSSPKFDLIEICLLQKIRSASSFRNNLIFLELSLVSFSSFTYKSLLKELKFLQVLKIGTLLSTRYEFLFLTQKLLNLGEVCKTLKKFDLSLGKIENFDVQNTGFVVNTLNLEEFSFKLENDINWTQASLSLGNNLQVFKVPQILFNPQSATEFCHKLENLGSLRKLQVSDSIVQAGNIFFELIQSQSALQVLKLEPTSEDFTLDTEEILTLLQSVNTANIKSIKVHSSKLYAYANIIELSSQPEFGFIDQELSRKLVTAISAFIDTSPNLQKLDLEIKYLPQKFFLQISEKIQKNANLNNFQSFSKYNLRHLLSENCSIIDLKILSWHKSLNVLFYLLFAIISKNSKIREVREKYYSCPWKKSKSKLEPLTVVSASSLKLNSVGTPVGSFITICLIPRNFPLVEHLDLSSICVSPFILLFSKQLLQFPNLLTLKFSILTLPKLFENSIYEIFTSASRLKSLKSLFCNIQSTISRMNKVFYLFSRHKNLEIFHLTNSKILTVQSISQELSLKEVFGVNTIKRLALVKCALTFTKFSQICEVLASSVVLEHIELDDVTFVLDPWEKHFEDDENKWKNILKHFFMFVGSIKGKKQYQTIKLRLAELPPSRFPIFPQIVDEYLGLCGELLRNNRLLQNFSVIFPVSQEFLPKYSQFFLGYLKVNPNLLVLNYYKIKKIVSEEVPVIKTKKFFVQMNKNIFNTALKPQILLTEPDEKYGNMGTVTSLMPLILSELVKNKANFYISTFNRTVSKLELMNQILTIMRIGDEFTLFETTEKTFILNCLSSCMTVRKLIIADIYLYRLDIQVLISNLPKMVNLKFIKVKNLKFRSIDYAIFLLPPGLIGFSLICLDIQKIELKNWSSCVMRKEICKFSARSVNGFVNNDRLVEFFQRIKHGSIRELKLKFPFTAANLQILATVLRTKEFPSLQKLKVMDKVFEGFESFENLAEEINVMTNNG